MLQSYERKTGIYIFFFSLASRVGHINGVFCFLNFDVYDFVFFFLCFTVQMFKRVYAEGMVILLNGVEVQCLVILSGYSSTNELSGYLTFRFHVFLVSLLILKISRGRCSALCVFQLCHLVHTLLLRVRMCNLHFPSSRTLFIFASNSKKKCCYSRWNTCKIFRHRLSAAQTTFIGFLLCFEWVRYIAYSRVVCVI